MLEVLGYASRAALMDAIVPAAIRRRAPLALPGAMTEAQALARMRSIASRNKVLKSFIGQGYYGTHTPGVILRNVLENPAWYTAYTPYQPEISQGRLEALINFQTMVCDLTGDGDRQRVDAGRGDRGGRGDDAVPPRRAQRKQPVLRRRRCLRADDRRRADACEAARDRGCDRPRGRRGKGRGLRGPPPVSGRQRRRARLPRARGPRARRRRTCHRRRRPPGADAADTAGRMGCRCRRRLGAAVRGADGLRRPACRLSRDARRAQALDARAPCRRHRRCQRRPRVPPGAADARTAHTAREGDIEHLHGAGAARGDRGHVRGLPRPCRASRRSRGACTG